MSAGAWPSFYAPFGSRFRNGFQGWTVSQLPLDANDGNIRFLAADVRDDQSAILKINLCGSGSQDLSKPSRGPLSLWSFCVRFGKRLVDALTWTIFATFF